MASTPATGDAGRHLRVSALHEIYYEDHGPRAAPAFLFVHGGPGIGFGAGDRGFFDLARHRVVLFDQRGAGRSRPFAEVRENTTPDLVADMERLRVAVGIERWILFGGSWGSTLALAYALAHPRRVAGLVLRGVFLANAGELDWAYRCGANRVFPEEWARFLEPLGGQAPASVAGLIEAYAERFGAADPAARDAAIRAWVRWEAVNSFAQPDAAQVRALTESPRMRAMAELELHYFRHGAFLDADDCLVRDAARLAGIPAHIVQGRRDNICPPWSAWRLHRALPGSRLEIVEGAGHSAHDPAIKAALRAAAAAMADALA